MKLRGTCKNCGSPVQLEPSGHWGHNKGLLGQVFPCTWRDAIDPLLLEVP